MSQTSTTQSERLVEFNKLLPELKIFLRHILDNEELSDSSKGDCSRFIERLENITKPPSLPPRSGRSSTTTSSPLDIQEDSSSPISKSDVENISKSVISPEFIEQQRELSRKSTLWKHEKKPSLTSLSAKPEQTEKSVSNDNILNLEENKDEEYMESDTHYERIKSVSSADKKFFSIKNPSTSEYPPPVPHRTSIPSKNKVSSTGIKIVDLKNPLYSGLLRNVGSNTKQWCVIKYQKLFLFNDLQEPVAFTADLTKYEVIKDPSEMYVFRVTQHGEPSIVLAAVDEGQYELWHDAFKKAKQLKEETEYLSFKGECELDDEEIDGPYEKPDDYLSDRDRTKSPEEIYVPMNPIVSPPVSSPPKYETMEYIRSLMKSASDTDYSSMPLPPIPNQDDAPPLPARRKYVLQDFSKDDDSGEYASFESSSESIHEIRSDSDTSKSNEKFNNFGSPTKNRENEFLNDITCTHSGILHQRKMLAVWQKRYCKVKDQTLFCYRSADALEPVLYLPLPGYKLDRAEETWRSFAFKIYKDAPEGSVYYFAAINNTEQMRWLSVLAKEINREKFQSTLKIETEKGSQYSHVSSEESFDEASEGIEKFSPAVVNGSSSDFGDDDSIVEEKNRIVLKNKHLDSAVQRSRKPRGASFEDSDADQQGYLYRKHKNHWGKRWCVVKEKKFLSFKNTPNELPDFSILLEYAALTTPLDNEDVSSGYFLFKIRYEGDQSVVYRTKQQDDWKKWVACIKNHVGSTSEEVFPYINVPPMSPSHGNIDFVDADDPDYNTIPSDYSSMRRPFTTVSSTTSSNASLPAIPIVKTLNTPVSKTIPHLHKSAPPWSETEIEDSYINGKLVELQICNHSFRHIERFVLITKEKWLKVYEAINSTTAILSYNALDIEVKEEVGAGEQVLHLLLGNVEIELLLKAADKEECELWKSTFDKIHYEEIDEEELSRPRSRSNDKKNKQESPTTFGTAHSKTLPNLGKRKKAAKEQKDVLSKIKSNVQSDTQSPHRKKNAISALIRSFTIDTLGRKAKNKSYELPREGIKEEDIVLKETQHGLLKQVLLKDDSEVYEERFCRIRGKVFQCYNKEFDIKPLFKVPLKNAAIEDFANSGIYGFVITALDTGKEYKFTVDTEPELERWTGAFFGDDQLHKSLENSPQVPRRISSSTFYTPNSPGLVRLSTSSKDSFPEEGEAIVEQNEQNILKPPHLTEGEELLTINELSSDKENTDKTMEETRNEHKKLCDSTSTDGMQIFNKKEISDRKFSETDGSISPMKNEVQPLYDEPIKYGCGMFELSKSDLSHTKTKRWLVLRKSVIEVYNREEDKSPLKVIPFSAFELEENEDNSGKEKLRIVLKKEDDSFTHHFIAPDDNTHKLWIDEIKRNFRSLKRRRIPRSSVAQIIRRLGSVDKLKEMKKKDKRLSMLLVDDDVKVIEKFEDTADPAKIISGILYEIFDESKTASEKGRHCWIKNGIFHVAKLLKPDKPIKNIDLSTVVILDESDPNNRRHAFRLDYTKSDGNRSYIRLRATDEYSADKWMVAVSMGILYHRLSIPHTRDSSVDDDSHDQFEFVSLSQSIEKQRTSSTLEVRIQEEVEKQLNEKDPQSLRLINEQIGDKNKPTEINMTDQNNTDDNPQKKDIVDGEENITNDTATADDNENVERQLSQLGDEEDHVFNVDQYHEAPFEVLEHIPEKENAKESFKNVKGILRQQESIRRTILRSQREKKIPPPVKPKPKSLTNLSQSTILHKYGPIEDLSLSQLQAYQEKLEAEKTAVLKCIKNMSNVVQEAKENLDKGRSPSETSLSRDEYNTVSEDLERLQTQLNFIEKELKEVQTQITRKVASKGMGIQKKLSSNSEVSMLRDDRGRINVNDEYLDSIII